MQEVRMGEICQVNLMGNVQISTQAVQSLCEAELPVCYFSHGRMVLRDHDGAEHEEHVSAAERSSGWRMTEWFALSLARSVWWRGRSGISGRCCSGTMWSRGRWALGEMKRMADGRSGRRHLEELLGIEGNAARVYFGAFAGMIKVGE